MLIGLSTVGGHSSLIKISLTVLIMGCSNARFDIVGQAEDTDLNSETADITSVSENDLKLPEIKQPEEQTEKSEVILEGFEITSPKPLEIIMALDSSYHAANVKMQNELQTELSQFMERARRSGLDYRVNMIINQSINFTPPSGSGSQEFRFFFGEVCGANAIGLVNQLYLEDYNWKSKARFETIFISDQDSDYRSSSLKQPKSYSSHRVHTIVGQPLSSCPIREEGLVFKSLAASSGGLDQDICAPTKSLLDKLADKIFTVSGENRFQLSLPWNPEMQVIVKIDGETISKGTKDSDGYHLSVEGELSFDPGVVPQEAKRVEISYGPLPLSA